MTDTAPLNVDAVLSDALTAMTFLGNLRRGIDGAEKVLEAIRLQAQMNYEIGTQIRAKRAELEKLTAATVDDAKMQAQAEAAKIISDAKEAAKKTKDDSDRANGALYDQIAERRMELASIEAKITEVKNAAKALAG